jgi:hypothetical protein
VPAHSGGVHDRLLRDPTRVGGEELGREVVAALDDHVVARRELDGVVREHPLRVTLDAELGHQAEQRGCRGLDLRLADVVVAKEDLTMEVRGLDDVVVGDADRAHAGACERHRGGTAEATRADHEDTRACEDESIGHGETSTSSALTPGKYSSRLK